MIHEIIYQTNQPVEYVNAFAFDFEYPRFVEALVLSRLLSHAAAAATAKVVEFDVVVDQNAHEQDALE